MDLFGPFIIYYGKFYRKDHQYPLLSNTTWTRALLPCGIDDSSSALYIVRKILHDIIELYI